MNKLENVTVIFLESDDFILPGKVSDTAQREVDTADIVVDQGFVVKNRLGELSGEHS